MATKTATKAKTTKPAKATKTTKTAQPAKSAAQAVPKRGRAAPAAGRMSLDEVMEALEKAGTAQTKKIYARHGAREPMFGVQFAFLKTLHKKIGVDHDLALALWDTGNFDARNLAFKIVDPASITAKNLDRWSRDMTVRMCAGYVSALATETAFGPAKAREWLASPDEQQRCAGWVLVGQLAMRVPTVPDAWLLDCVKDIERGLQAAPNDERYAMNNALIALGGRSPALKKAVLAAARKIGKVVVDHGDTSCKTPDAVSAVEKAWEHAAAKGFATPALQEQRRESPRTRC